MKKINNLVKGLLALATAALTFISVSCSGEPAKPNYSQYFTKGVLFVYDNATLDYKTETPFFVFSEKDSSDQNGNTIKMSFGVHTYNSVVIEQTDSTTYSLTGGEQSNSVYTYESLTGTYNTSTDELEFTIKYSTSKQNKTEIYSTKRENTVELSYINGGSYKNDGSAIITIPSDGKIDIDDVKYPISSAKLEGYNFWTIKGEDNSLFFINLRDKQATIIDYGVISFANNSIELDFNHKDLNLITLEDFYGKTLTPLFSKSVTASSITLSKETPANPETGYLYGKITNDKTQTYFSVKKTKINTYVGTLSESPFSSANLGTSPSKTTVCSFIINDNKKITFSTKTGTSTTEVTYKSSN